MSYLNKISLIILIALLLFYTASSCDKNKSFNELRTDMIENHLINRGINDPHIVKAFSLVPREEFVKEEHKRNAYNDFESPTKFQQTLDRPYEDAIMIKALALEPDDNVLEIGTGVGHLSALISVIVKKVYSIEIDPQIADEARKNLKRLGFRNVEVKTGDGFVGWPEHAPFDAIVMVCSPPEVPKPLIAQLKENGRIVLPLGGERKFQELILYKKENGKLIELRRLAPTSFVPMKGKVLENNM